MFIPIYLRILTLVDRITLHAFQYFCGLSEISLSSVMSAMATNESSSLGPTICASSFSQERIVTSCFFVS